MKFYELIESNSWLSIEIILLKLYPDEKKNISEYEDVFHKLNLMSPINEDKSIIISNEKDDFDDEEYVDVSGKYNNPQNEQEDFSQALEYSPWNEWLGMDIEKQSLLNFSELEIIAHCLYEMTFISFEEGEIEQEMSNMNKEVEQIKNMTKEERKNNLISLEDLFKDLDDEENMKTK